jgi:hypothetical protein
MKRSDIVALGKMGGEAVLITIFVGILIGVIGYWKEWETSATYSNAFFIAGCLMFIGGAYSRRAAGEEWGIFQMINAESLGKMSPGERLKYIVTISSSFRLVILGGLSGILLFIISLLVWNID